MDWTRHRSTSLFWVLALAVLFSAACTTTFPRDQIPLPGDGAVNCGSGSLDVGEQCDGVDLGGETCTGLGYDSGELTCSASCTFDRSHCVGGHAPAWHLPDWSYRKALQLDAAGFCATVSGFPVPVILSDDADLQNHALVSGFDILFTTDDGITKLPHEIESFAKVDGNLVAWVTIDITMDEGQTIYVYYGNAGATDQQNRDAVWDADFQGVWHLNDDTGAANPDATSNGNDGAPASTGAMPSQQMGKIAGAINFDSGAEQTRIVLPATTSLDLEGYENWTISAWINPSAGYEAADFPSVYTLGDWRASLGIAVASTAPAHGQVQHLLNDLAPNAGYSASTVTTGGWTHIAVVRDSSTTRIYLNGVEDGAPINSVAIDQAGQASYIGGFPGYSDGDFNGVIDEVRVSSTNRSAAWIHATYCTANGVIGSIGEAEIF
jgi:Concanavalin A-like lectin/glucanases superfamily/Domain of unknown function (DUF2341)